MKKCLIKNCLKIYYAKGYCKTHYEQFRATGSPYRNYFINKNKICKVPECLSSAEIKGLCAKHYSSYKNHHSYKKLSPKGKRNTNWKGGIAEYPSHYLMKKNRLIILTRYPICQECSSKASIEIHHCNGNKSDHRFKNLMAVCHRCNGKLSSKFYLKYGLTIKEITKKLHIATITVYKLERKRRLSNSLNIP